MAKISSFLVALGGGDEIGASSYLLEVDGKRGLVDAGLRLKGGRHFPDYEFISQIGMVSLNQCDAVFLTHAHMDHSGSPPVGFHANSQPCQRNSHFYNCANKSHYKNPAQRYVERLGLRHEEFVGDLDIQEFEKSITETTLETVQPVKFGQSFQAAPGIQATYFPAGHILGAAMVLIEIGEFRV